MVQIDKPENRLRRSGGTADDRRRQGGYHDQSEFRRAIGDDRKHRAAAAWRLRRRRIGSRARIVYGATISAARTAISESFGSFAVRQGVRGCDAGKHRL